MRHSIKRSLGLPFILLAVLGSAQAQTPRDDPSRFLANPEVRKAIEDQMPLTSVPLQPYGPFYLVDVKINDQGPFKFVIDIGTPSTIVDAAVARELGVSADGAGSGSRVKLDALTLGSARFAGVEAEVQSLDEIWGDGSPSGA